ncbi:MAG: hypothetical protein Q9160_000650 [Pyrenula sp. 1 TL-2023]
MPHRAASPARSENEFDLSAALFHDNNESDPDVPASALPNRSKESLDFLEPLSDGNDESIIADQLAASNRKASNLKGRSVKKGGGFQALGLNANLLKAITRKGFAVPTPIQRKTVPLLLQDKDVVGMARTGSGKTAAFVIPLIEKLKMHSTKVGARAVVLSPSRELALQTLHVVKELGRVTDLKTVLLVGGDSLEEQFRSMASNPDIVIATPGRFLHLKVEMGLELSSMRYVVFDEADRLFEMGFAIQLTEILHALPASRQTMLFSATLPKSLVEFARAGLQDPVLVRLDTDSKISPDLKSAFFTVKSADKEGALLHILQDIIGISQTSSEIISSAPDTNGEAKNSKKRKRGKGAGDDSKQVASQESTIVFAATKHHVEYLAHLLRLAGYMVSHVYGSLDQTARKTQVQAFREGDTNILVVTDVAARGIDVPLLANVINYDFPPQPKVFVHRVGRTARAGQTGWSYSIVRDADAPYLLDLQLFLSKRLVLGRADAASLNFADVVSVGSLQRDGMERCSEWVSKTIGNDIDLSALRDVAAKGEKLYLRTRNAASAESAKRARSLTSSPNWTSLHPLFNDGSDNLEAEREKMLARVGGFRPQESIFEIGARRTGKKYTDENIDSIKRIRSSLETKKRRVKPSDARDTFVETALSTAQPIDENTVSETGDLNAFPDSDDDGDEGSDNVSLASTSSLEVTFSQPTSTSKFKQKQLRSTEDPGENFRSSNYISYTPNNTSLAEDHAYAVHSEPATNTGFVSAARSATMDLTTDDTARGYGRTSGMMRWDKRAKKYVRRANDADGSKGNRKMVKGESGAKIAASFRSGRFDAWKKRERLGRLPRVGEVEGKTLPGAQAGLQQGKRYRHTKTEQAKRPDKLRGDYEKRAKKFKEAGDRELAERGKNEVRGNEEIRKRRKEKEKRREKNSRPVRKKGRGRT